MKAPMYLTSERLARLLAGAALAAMAVVQAHAAPADTQAGKPGKAVMQTSTTSTASTTSEASEPGTIPAARPGLPQMQRGAEGPLRTDEHLRKADPSIRDTNPLTVNGLWETLPGNVIAQPRP
jgi:hypothetical protein